MVYKIKKEGAGLERKSSPEKTLKGVFAVVTPALESLLPKTDSPKAR